MSHYPNLLILYKVNGTFFMETFTKTKVIELIDIYAIED